MLTYFLQVNLCWLLFYALYYVLLSKETFFTLNRIYLIISLLAGLLLPLSADWLRTETPLFIYVPMDSIMLPEFVVGMKEQAVLLPKDTEGGNFLTWWTLLIALYQLGVGFMAIRFIYGLFHIYKIFKTTTIEKESGYIISNTVIHPDTSGKGLLAQPFSFFNMIFIDKNKYQTIEYQNIMQHEKAHARQLHSLDVVFLELLKIVFWYSPIVYLYRHSLRNIHEYLADAAVLRSVSKKQYGTLLIQQAQSANVLALVNPFFSQLKKRIVMMTRNPSKRRSLVKYTLAVPVFLLLVSFLASPKNAVMVNTAKISVDVKNSIGNSPISDLINSIENTDNQAFINGETPIFKVTLAGFESGFVSAELVQQQTQFKLIQPNGKRCDVQSCRVFKQLADGSITNSITNTGGVFKPEVRTLFETLQKGERLYFNMIKVRCPGDINAQDYGNMIFDIKADNKGFSSDANMTDTTKPNAIFAFSNGHVQGFISAKEMKMHKEIMGLELGKKPQRNCEILSFTITKTAENGTTEKADNQTGKFNNEALRLIASAKMGDNFVFSNIKMKNSEGSILEPSETRFTVNSEQGDTKYNINLSDNTPMPRVGTPNKDGVYTIVEQQPEFLGGAKAMFAWLGQNIKYPTKARENGVEGTVYIGFVVQKDGSLSNVSIKRGISSDCNEEAVRVISAMPKWKPGMQDGKAVAVAYTLPIKFKLEQTKQPEPKGVVIFENLKTENNTTDNTLFSIVDEQPQFVGGQDTMFRWLMQNIRYPKEAREKRAEGTVYVGFVVEKDGSIKDVAIKREPSYPKDTLKIMEVNGIQGIKLINSKAEGSLGREAIRIISAMPKWKPGRNQGQPVRVAYTLPIKFKLE
jgi:TonB family protein